MKNLDGLLQDWRVLMGITQAAAARRCTMSRSQWAELESGVTRDPRATTLLKLHRGTGVAVEKLAECAEYSTAER